MESTRLSCVNSGQIIVPRYVHFFIVGFFFLKHINDFNEFIYTFQSPIYVTVGRGGVDAGLTGRLFPPPDRTTP